MLPSICCRTGMLGLMDHLASQFIDGKIEPRRHSDCRMSQHEKAKPELGSRSPNSWLRALSAHPLAFNSPSQPLLSWWTPFPTKKVDEDFFLLEYNCFLGFPSSSAGEESAWNAGYLGSIPGLGRSPGGGHGNPLQYSCLENPYGQRNLGGYSPWGHKESDTTEWLST